MEQNREERRQEERKRHHRPLTYSLREAGFEVPDVQSPRKSGDKSSEGPMSSKASTSRAQQENYHMDEQQTQQAQQAQQTQPQPPIPGGMEGVAWGMGAFQNALNSAAKSYGKAKLTNTLIDLGSYTLKAAVVVGVIAAGAAITKAILGGASSPITVTSLPATPPVG